MKTGQKQDRGVAGLTILLSLVVMLFIIGLLVMIFTLMGGALEGSSYDTTAGTIPAETLTTVTASQHNFSVANFRDVTCSLLTVSNTSTAVLIYPEGNYTTSKCSVTGLAGNHSYFAQINNETLTTVDNQTGELVSVSTLTNAQCTVQACINSTSNHVIPTTDWQGVACRVSALINTTANNYTNTDWKCSYNYTYDRTSLFNNTNWDVSYTYIYEADTIATGVMNDTTSGIAGVVDWMDIFIVIGAMVVLILLTVIIITSIRGSGMVDGGGNSGQRDVGTA